MLDKEQVRAANRLESLYHDLTNFTLRGQGAERSGLCPFHDDERPSFSINIGEQVWKCHGCDVGGDVFAFVQRLLGFSFEEALGWLAARSGGTHTRREVVARYEYQNEQEQLLFVVNRTRPKGFFQTAPDGTWSLRGIDRVPYRLPELIAADKDALVFVVEGEKDVDRLRALGLTATTNPGGAGKWRPAYNRPLHGRKVVILPDNDEPGLKHAHNIAATLRGHAAWVKVLRLPGLCPKGDVSEWLDAGHDVRELLRLVEETPDHDLSNQSSSPSPIENLENRETSGLKLTLVAELISETPEHIPWLVHDLLPIGGLSFLAAKPKVGKSTLARNLAVAVARGTAFLGLPTAKGPVLYFAMEEKRAEIRQHFHRMGVTDETIYVHVGAAPRDAVTEVERLIEEHHPVLVIVDPLSRVLRLVDWNDYGKVTKAMEPWVDLARRTTCHILCLHHMNKARELVDLDALNGSVGFSGAIDSGLLMIRYENDRAITSQNRYGTELKPTRLVLDPTTGIITPAGPASVDPESRRADDILRLLADGTPRSEVEIKTALGGNQTTTANALRTLRDDRIVELEGEGRRNSPFIYRLARPP